MIFTLPGAGIVYNGVTYTVGMRVLANDQSDFQGLFGTITEIRTGDDQETENETPDIECCFEYPVLKEEVSALEAHFSDLYQEPKTLDDLPLDMVIMAPEELKPIDNLPNTDVPIYVVMNEWENDDGHGHSESCFTDYDAAKRQFNLDLEEEKLNGASVLWREQEGFMEEEDKNYYSCGVKGAYTYHYFTLYLDKRLLPISPAFAAEAAKHHARNTHLNDLMSLLPKDTAFPTCSDDMRRLAQRIESALSKSEPCSDAYWETLQALAEELKGKLVSED